MIKPAIFNNRIAYKFVLPIVLLLLLAFFILTFVFIRHEKSILFSEKDLYSNSLARNLAYNAEYGVLTQNFLILDNLIKGVMVEHEVIAIKILNKDGKILASAGGKRKPYYECQHPVLTKKIIENDLAKEEEFFFPEKEKMKEEVIGAVYLASSRIGIKRKLNDIVKRTTGLTLIILVFVIGLIFVIVQIVFAPIKELLRATEKISSGNLEHRVEIKTKDEFKKLADSFNKMTEELAKTMLSQDFFDNIIKSLADSLIVANFDGIIRRVNKVTLDLFGYREEEMVGKPLDLFFEDSLLANFRFDKFSEKGYINNFEFTCKKKNGDLIPISFSASLMRDKENAIQGLVCLIRDITERKQAEWALKSYNEKLLRSGRNMENFLYIASHDLQEPLRKVKAFSNILEVKYEQIIDQRGYEYFSRLQGAVDRMQMLINGLLNFSRIIAENRKFEMVDLNQLLKKAISDLYRIIKDSGAQLDAGVLPSIEADPLQIQELFRHLIDNSLKFKKKDEPAIIKVYAEPPSNSEQNFSHGQNNDGMCQIIFEDNGVGFDEKYNDRIFKVFQRLYSGNEYEGVGVGLAICQKIVEQHNGAITAKSIPGTGSKFIITLPIKQEMRDVVN